MRVALFGSPAFALPVLERLVAEHELALVVSQPDAPAGRGMRVRAPAVAERARELGLPVAQPTRLKRDVAFAERLAAADLDVAVTAAYGRILPPSLLAIPRHGFLNAHASILPELRGAAPIQWALIRGYRETGVTVMQTDPGLDTGPIRHVVRTDVAPDETAPELSERLARLAADAMSYALAALAAGDLPSEPQDDTRATHAPLLSKEDGRVRWQDDARAVMNRWRGVLAWPGSRFEHGGRRVRADRLDVAEDAREGDGGDDGDHTASAQPPDASPGTVQGGTVLAVADGAVRVACGAGAIRLLKVTPAGRRTMAADEWAHGVRLGTGDRLA